MLVKERAVALDAVQKAMVVCRQVYCQLRSDDTEYKSDASPVTVADYAAQAVVNTILSEAFPNIKVVGEEDAGSLRDTHLPHVVHLRERITALANSVLEPPRTTEQLLAAIDRGCYEGGPHGQHWTLDPIDGTKGFVRGGQYAVCLALINNGQVELGVLGCPNLPVERGHLYEAAESIGTSESSDGIGQRGILFVATRGGGAFQRTWGEADEKPIQLKALDNSKDGSVDFTNARLCESWEAAHSDHGTNEKVMSALGIKGRSARLDSQCKYGVVARGEADIYLRLPTRPDYVEKIWDHAAGALIVEEAGARITDADNKPLQFGCGRFLSNNRGIVVAHRDAHATVMKALQQHLN
ncbi:hypothetical protein BDF19DRAFT_150050 [Syncephalis fuscata]|nr:hypothetical protein BDF19DRAFT_150050 [Syncephalis fuscata]